MKDLYNHIDVVTAVKPAALTASGDTGAIDLAGFGSAVLSIMLGDGTGLTGENKVSFALEHSDDGATFTPVTSEYDLQGFEADETGKFYEADSPAKAADTVEVGYIGDKHYIKLIYTVAGTVNMAVAVAVIKGHGVNVPAVTD